MKGQTACLLTLLVALLILSLAAASLVMETVTVTVTHHSGTQPTTGSHMDTYSRKASQSMFDSCGQLI